MTIEVVIPKSVFANDEAKEEFNKIKEIEKNVDREKLFYKSNKNKNKNENENKYSFKNFRTIKTFGEDVYNGEITLKEADKDQSDLLEKVNDFTKKTRPLGDMNKQEKENVKKNL